MPTGRTDHTQFVAAPKPKASDVIIWPDGTWCLRENSEEYTHMGDDRRVLYEDTPEWIEFFS